MDRIDELSGGVAPHAIVSIPMHGTTTRWRL